MDRSTWAAQLLDVQPGERILEIGCGAGVLAALLHEQGADVHAIDRSATAVARARRRGVDAEQLALADLDTARRFDKAVAVNLNLFWTGDAAAELGVLGTVLDPGGLLLLVYEFPGPVRSDALERAAANLTAAGFAAEIVAGPTPSRAAIRATRQRGS